MITTFYRNVYGATGKRMLVTVCGLNHGLQTIQNHPKHSVAKQSLLYPQHLLQTTGIPHHLQYASLFFQRDISVPEKHDPQKGDLVYVGTISRMIRLVKLFSLSTSALGISLQPFLLEQVSNLHWALATMVGGVSGFFVLVTPLLLHIVTKRYVTAMYLNRDTGVFTAKTYTFLLREKEHSFTASDYKTPKTAGLLTTAIIKDKTPLFIDPGLFLDREAHIQLMKYDEPLEWEIPDQDDVKKSQQ